MVELDAKSAADRIRADVVGKPDIPADARHALAFAKDVCAELGLDPDPPAMMAVTQALERAGIKPHVAQEYPKMLTENGKPVKDEHGNNVVFNSAEEEAGWTKPAEDKAGNPLYQASPKALEYPKPLKDAGGQPVRDPSGAPIVFIDAAEEKAYWDEQEKAPDKLKKHK